MILEIIVVNKTSQPVKWIIILCGLLMGEPPTPRDIYIDQYKDLAVVEMHRKGIPASIKLAQAILESQSGTSSFATRSNNHFGIKCKSSWVGDTYYHKDDDVDTEGKLIPSCFRSYERVVDSYVDHSNFLSERSYYARLWTLSRYDYHSWARGLQACGYATDPNYAEKLIKIIEKEALYKYDVMSTSDLSMK